MKETVVPMLIGVVRTILVRLGKWEIQGRIAAVLTNVLYRFAGILVGILKNLGDLLSLRLR